MIVHACFRVFARARVTAGPDAQAALAIDPPSTPAPTHPDAALPPPRPPVYKDPACGAAVALPSAAGAGRAAAWRGLFGLLRWAVARLRAAAVAAATGAPPPAAPADS
jgi:hypothetical protein